jgi:hypothetical protein
MQQAREVRPLSAAGNYKASADECQDVCFSDPGCSIWEHSTTEGCWYGYSDECVSSSEAAKTMVAGERVARACNVGLASQRHTDYLQVFGIIGAVAFLFTCLAMALLLGLAASRSERCNALGSRSSRCEMSSELQVDDGSSGSD